MNIIIFWLINTINGLVDSLDSPKIPCSGEHLMAIPIAQINSHRFFSHVTGQNHPWRGAGRVHVAANAALALEPHLEPQQLATKLAGEARTSSFPSVGPLI